MTLNARYVLGKRQGTTQLVGDDSVGDGNWQCVSGSCSNPSSGPTSGLTCNGQCLQLDLSGGTDAQVGVQRSISAGPLIGGGGSFHVSFGIIVFWNPSTPSSTTPESNPALVAASYAVHPLVTVAGTPITFTTFAGAASQWYTYTSSSFIPSGFSSSSATVTIGFNAGVPMGNGHYTVWIDEFSLTVPTSSSGVQQTSVASVLQMSSSQTASGSATISGIGNSASSLVVTLNSTISNSLSIGAVGVNGASSSLGGSSRSTGAGSGVGVGSSQSGDGSTSSTNIGLVVGAVIVGVIVLLVLASLCWLLKRRRWKESRAPETKMDRPFLGAGNSFAHSGEAYELGSSTGHLMTPHSEFGHSPATSTPMTEQEELRQWMTSPTEMLPAYQTELGSAIAGPEGDIAYGQEAPDYRPVLRLHNGLDEERGGSTKGDVLVPKR